jgi:hypothetical protein
MRRLFAALAGFLAMPVAFEGVGWLPPFFVLGPSAWVRVADASAAPPLIAAPGLAVAGLLLSWAFRRGVFERLSAALAVGLAAGLTAAVASAVHHDVAAVAPAFVASLGLSGAVCGFVMHAIGVALGAGGAEANADADADADRFAQQPGEASPVPSRHRPVARLAIALDRRHPARLKRVYRPFHIAVTWTFAAAWLAALWLVGIGIRRFAGAGLDDAALSSLPGSMAAGVAAALACAVLAAAVLAVTACIAWWVTAAVCVSAAVRSGALPPFDTALYIRDGTFPSHWVAHEHALRG